MIFALLKCLGSLKPNIFQTRRSRLHTLQAQKNPTFFTHQTHNNFISLIL